MNNQNKTRLFFVVDQWSEDFESYGNCEIFETLEEAEKWAEENNNSTNIHPRIRVAMTKNAYREDNGEWNYEDFSDTFEFIRTIESK